MLESVDPPVTQDASVTVSGVVRLCADIAAFVTTTSHPVAAPVSVLVDGQPVKRPQMVSRFTTGDGATQLLILMRSPDLLAAGGVLQVRGADGAEIFTRRLEAPAAGDLAVLATVLRGLAPRDLGRAVQALFDSGPAMLQVQQDAEAVATLRRVLDAVFTPPGVTAPIAAAGAGYALCQGVVPAGLGPLRAVVAVGTGRIWRNPVEALVQPAGRTMRFDLMLALREGGRAPQALLLFGEGGVCCRRLPPGTPQRLFDGLVAKRGGLADATRAYVFRTLAAGAAENPAAAALLRDAQFYAPAVPAEVRSPGEPVGLGVELAVGHGIGGLFVKGWLRDPYDAVERMAAVAPDGTRQTLDGFRVRFPRPDVDTLYADSPHPAGRPDLGFAVFVADGGASFPVHQYAIEATLRSGAVLRPVPPPAPTTLRAVRDAVLAAVPSDRLVPEAIAGLLATPVATVQRSVQEAWCAPEVVAFGEPPRRPTASLIIPLYRNLDYVRFQYAAFALDPAMAAAELVFVLDSPEQRSELEHFLRCLEQLYGLPCRLAVMSGNFGFASACNTGAVIARGETLVFVNSDVLPTAPGWLAPLQAVLAARPDIAAVGPKLLFDDDSLQHAGLYFDRDYLGRWYNHHYFKGMPRDFPSAGVARLVPGVTAATLMIRRSVFEDVGGFSEDYVVGDFEDSDLCLKVRATGHAIAYVPQAELYHYERRSIEHHAGYTKTAASLYNQWLHASRWSDLMGEVMAQPLTALDAPAPHS